MTGEPSGGPRRSSLQEELKQGKPFPTAAEEAGVALLRTAALFRRAVAQRVEPYGISPAQYNVLRILRGAGDEGLATLAVRDRLIEEAPGITRLIDKLEEAGHVRRDRTGKDRRTVRCRITSKGLALLEEMDSPVRTANELIRAGLPEEEDQRMLLDLLARLRSPLLALVLSLVSMTTGASPG
jgi:DNA-binding MarR family transcriptional regulator